MDLMEAIKGRRSIRKYKPDPVPEEAFRTVDGGGEMVSILGQYPMLGSDRCKRSKVKSELATALPKGESSPFLNDRGPLGPRPLWKERESPVSIRAKQLQ